MTDFVILLSHFALNEKMSSSADSQGASLEPGEPEAGVCPEPGEPEPEAAAPPDLEVGPELFLNRELGWLAFDSRVLHEAEDARNPLLERVKFLAIADSNLDEFVMKRMGGLKQQLGAGLRDRTPDGRTPAQRQRYRMRVTGVTLDDLRRVGDAYLKPEQASQAVITSVSTAQQLGDHGMEILPL